MNSQSPQNGIFAAAGLALFVAFLMVPAARAQSYGPWSAPVNLNEVQLSDGTQCGAVVNSPFNDNHPAISKDGLTLIFTSDRPGGSGGLDLWLVHRDSLDDCWKEPVTNLGPLVNSAFDDAAPNLTNDGHWLYFHRQGPSKCVAPGVVVFNLWVTHRQDAGDDSGWEDPINLGCTINKLGFEQAGPLQFEDETTGVHYLYFTRKPTGASNSLLDIYVSTCTSDLATCNTQGLWDQGTPVDKLNSPFRDTRTAIRRRDGLEMILSTGRPGSLGNEDLWVSTRPAVTPDQANWSMPVPINCDWLPTLPQYLECLPHPPDVAHINSSAFDGAPALSWDGTELYFFSERTDLPGFAGGRDLYVSKRTKLP